MNLLNADFNIRGQSKAPRINDIGLEVIKENSETKNDTDTVDEQEEYETEMGLISEQDIELEQEDFNFIDNISWDTSSLEDSFDDDPNMKEEGSCHGHSDVEP